MLHRAGDFEEWQLAEVAKKYIPLYLKKGDGVVYIPYIDDPTGEKKFIKYIYEEAIGWVYVDNSQGS